MDIDEIEVIEEFICIVNGISVTIYHYYKSLSWKAKVFFLSYIASEPA